MDTLVHSSSPLFTIDSVNLLWYDILRKIYREPCGFYNSQGFFYAQGDGTHAQTTTAPVFLPRLPEQM